MIDRAKSVIPCAKRIEAGTVSMDQVSVLLSLPVLHAVKHRFGSADGLCRSLGIREELLQDPDGRMDARQFDRLLAAAADECRNPNFGLTLGAAYSLDHMGLGGRQEAEFRFHVADPSRTPSHHLLDSILASTVSVFRKLTGERLLPKRAAFTQAGPADAEPYRLLFGDGLAFGQRESALVFDAAMLDLPVVYRNPQLLQLMEDHAASIIRKLRLETTFAETVSHAIVKQFDGTVPRIGDISRKLGVSVRSLQLQQERTTFQELLAAVRRGMAESMLRNRSLSIGEIAYAIGFSDPVAFHNAFKKWTGQTAGSYRKMDSFLPCRQVKRCCSTCRSK